MWNKLTYGDGWMSCNIHYIFSADYMYLISYMHMCPLPRTSKFTPIHDDRTILTKPWTVTIFFLASKQVKFDAGFW